MLDLKGTQTSLPLGFMVKLIFTNLLMCEVLFQETLDGGFLERFAYLMKEHMRYEEELNM